MLFPTKHNELYMVRPFGLNTNMLVCSVSEKKESISPLKKSFDKALQGGLVGAGAMSINVLSLMWMRTTVNYQYRHGTSTTQAFKTLYNDGGIPRFYRGILPALIQGPLSRFGDTAANVGVNDFLDSNEHTKDLPIAFKTLAASTMASMLRIALMPVDTTKTIMQVEGKNAIQSLISKVKQGGPSVLWHGSLGACSATFVGHYPWFLTYNTLNTYLPTYDRSTELSSYLARNAFIGFTASALSDTCSNSIRILKTYKQSSKIPITYHKAANDIMLKDGLHGLFFRGLNTKIISNGVQGLMFNVLWKLGQDYIQ